jgi:hypothetical protein
MAIRAADDRWAVENSARILEVYSVGPQVNFAFLRIPSEFANAREQSSYVFRHG